MINNLIKSLSACLSEYLENAVIGKEPQEYIITGPADDPGPASIPCICLYPSKFEISPAPGDMAPGQPRPKPMQQLIEILEEKPTGPYPLDHIPLKGSIAAKLILRKDTTSEKQQLLTEGEDFTVDYKKGRVSFKYRVKPVKHLLVDYSSVCIFTIKEFKQNLFIDIYADDMGVAERLSSLVIGIVLTNQYDLIKSCNTSARTEYHNGRVISEHAIDSIDLINGVPDYNNNIIRLRLRFEVNGNIRVTKEASGGFGLIEKVHSLGKRSIAGVNVDINLADPSGLDD